VIGKVFEEPLKQMEELRKLIGKAIEGLLKQTEEKDD
jgi:hypothetical protein